MESFVLIGVLAGVAFALFVVARAWQSFRYERTTREWSEKYYESQKHIRALLVRIEQSEALNRKKISDLIAKDELYEALRFESNFLYSKMPTLIADFETIQFEISANHLETKKNPARKEAARIRELREEARSLVEQTKLARYRYELLVSTFPELELYAEDAEALGKASTFDTLSDLTEGTDRTRLFMSKEEYESLPEPERNQLALDRYVESRKSKWEIGRDYEMFIGHEYEKRGWSVEYFGIDKKLEDLGRDLIAKNGSVTHIIQCKYWSKSKQIHENHICQLYGTRVHYILSQRGSKIPAEKISPVLITNISLSRTAQEFADYLGVKVIAQKPMQSFPRIKCNIGADGSKIYHLPMDQQYDNTKIDRPGELFAFTVKEAMDLGFRRAYRWSGAT